MKFLAYSISFLYLASPILAGRKKVVVEKTLTPAPQAASSSGLRGGKEMKKLQSDARSTLSSINQAQLKIFDDLQEKIDALREGASAAGTNVDIWKLANVIGNSNLFKEYLEGSTVYMNGDVYLKMERLVDNLAHDLRLLTLLEGRDISEEQQRGEKALYVELLRILTLSKALNHGLIQGSTNSITRDELQNMLKAPIQKLQGLFKAAPIGGSRIWEGINKQTPDWPVELSSSDSINMKIAELLRKRELDGEELIELATRTTALVESQYADYEAAIDLTRMLVRAAVDDFKFGRTDLAMTARALPSNPAPKTATVPDAPNMYYFLVGLEPFLQTTIRNLGLFPEKERAEENVVASLEAACERLEDLASRSHELEIETLDMAEFDEIASGLSQAYLSGLSEMTGEDYAEEIRSRNQALEAKLRPLIDSGRKVNLELSQALVGTLSSLSGSGASHAPALLERLRTGAETLKDDIEGFNMVNKNEEVDNIINLIRAAIKVITFSRGSTVKTTIHLEFLRKAQIIVWELAYMPDDADSIIIETDVPATDLSEPTQAVQAAVKSKVAATGFFKPEGTFLVQLRHWILSLMCSPEVPEKVFPGLIRIMELMEFARIPIVSATKAVSPKVLDTLRAVAFEGENLHLKEALGMLERLLSVDQLPRLQQGVGKLLPLLSRPEVQKISKGIMEKDLAAAMKRVQAILSKGIEPLKKELSNLKRVILSILNSVDEKVLLGEHINFDTEGLIVPRLG